MNKRLDILKKSLERKEKLFNAKLSNHFGTVKQANGQPLNDKQNGRATFALWDKQNNALRTLQESIKKTKQAIEKETNKIDSVEAMKEKLPAAILELIKKNELTQWRRHPTIFFVAGVDKARIGWDAKKKQLYHKYTNSITDKKQWRKFAKTFNTLSKLLNQ